MSALTSLLTSDTALGYLGTAVAYVLLRALDIFSKASAEKKASRAAFVAKAVHTAYGVVNEFKRLTATTADDKVALALKSADEYLASLKQAPLTEDEKARALLTFKALHGEGK